MARWPKLNNYLHFRVTNQLMEASAYDNLTHLHSEVGNLLVALIRSLRLKLQEGTWDRARISEAPAEYSGVRPDDDLLPSSLDPLPGGEG